MFALLMSVEAGVKNVDNVHKKVPPKRMLIFFCHNFTTQIPVSRLSELSAPKHRKNFGGARSFADIAVATPEKVAASKPAPAPRSFGNMTFVPPQKQQIKTESPNERAASPSVGEKDSSSTAAAAQPSTSPKPQQSHERRNLWHMPDKLAAKPEPMSPSRAADENVLDESRTKKYRVKEPLKISMQGGSKPSHNFMRSRALKEKIKSFGVSMANNSTTFEVPSPTVTTIADSTKWSKLAVPKHRNDLMVSTNCEDRMGSRPGSQQSNRQRGKTVNATRVTQKFVRSSGGPARGGGGIGEARGGNGGGREVAPPGRRVAGVGALQIAGRDQREGSERSTHAAYPKDPTRGAVYDRRDSRVGNSTDRGGGRDALAGSTLPPRSSSGLGAYEHNDKSLGEALTSTTTGQPVDSDRIPTGPSSVVESGVSSGSSSRVRGELVRHIQHGSMGTTVQSTSPTHGPSVTTSSVPSCSSDIPPRTVHESSTAPPSSASTTTANGSNHSEMPLQGATPPHNDPQQRGILSHQPSGGYTPRSLQQQMSSIPHAGALSGHIHGANAGGDSMGAAAVRGEGVSSAGDTDMHRSNTQSSSLSSSETGQASHGVMHHNLGNLSDECGDGAGGTDSTGCVTQCDTKCSTYTYATPLTPAHPSIDIQPSGARALQSHGQNGDKSSYVTARVGGTLQLVGSSSHLLLSRPVMQPATDTKQRENAEHIPVDVVGRSTSADVHITTHSATTSMVGSQQPTGGRNCLHEDAEGGGRSGVCAALAKDTSDMPRQDGHTGSGNNSFRQTHAASDPSAPWNVYRPATSPTHVGGRLSDHDPALSRQAQGHSSHLTVGKNHSDADVGEVDPHMHTGGDLSGDNNAAAIQLRNARRRFRQSSQLAQSHVSSIGRGPLYLSLKSSYQQQTAVSNDESGNSGNGQRKGSFTSPVGGSPPKSRPNTRPHHQDTSQRVITPSCSHDSGDGKDDNRGTVAGGGGVSARRASQGVCVKSCLKRYTHTAEYSVGGGAMARRVRFHPQNHVRYFDSDMCAEKISSAAATVDPCRGGGGEGYNSFGAKKSQVYTNVRPSASGIPRSVEEALAQSRLERESALGGSDDLSSSDESSEGGPIMTFTKERFRVSDLTRKSKF